MDYIPERGHAIWIQFNPQAGKEQAGRRPAVVLSPAVYNRRVGLAIVCPITNQIKGFPFEVLIPANHAVTGVILSDHVRSIDWHTRQADYICMLPPDVVREVLHRISTLIDPDQQ